MDLFALNYFPFLFFPPQKKTDVNIMKRRLKISFISLIVLTIFMDLQWIHFIDSS